MQTFTIGLGRGWWIKAVGRNALVRPSDRIEAWVFVLAALVVVFGTSVSCAIGTAVYDARSQLYAAQAQTKQQVTAVATEEAHLDIQADEVFYFVTAAWTAGARQHVDVVAWPNRAKFGDRHDIWVDDQGEYAEPPRGRSRAVTDAAAVALSVWLGVAATAIGMAYAVRGLLDRRRYAEWDREAYADEGKWRKHQ